MYDSGEPPLLEEPQQSGLSSVPGFDTTPPGIKFGEVLQDAEKSYFDGEKVVVKFQAANPRQNMKVNFAVMYCTLKIKKIKWNI